ncbi:HD domain-containing protein [Candidatus Saccharibacteria bacterium]|nr:HD domain-containing protein [Candidatus Saccharibacteria bacterium]
MDIPEFGSPAYQQLYDAIAEQAERGYINLPYHNWQHALQTQRVCRNLFERCQTYDVQLNPFVLDAASFLHDYNYHLPLASGGQYRSKEIRSSRAAGKILRSLDIEPAVIRQVQSAIRSTELGIPCRSLDDRAMRQADLSNVTENYGSFLLNTYRLYREAHQLNDNPPSLPRFIIGSVAVLSQYAREDVSLGPFDQDPSFMEAMFKNIDRLSQETPVSFMQSVYETIYQKVAS